MSDITQQLITIPGIQSCFRSVVEVLTNAIALTSSPVTDEPLPRAASSDSQITEVDIVRHISTLQQLKEILLQVPRVKAELIMILNRLRLSIERVNLRYNQLLGQQASLPIEQTRVIQKALEDISTIADFQDEVEKQLYQKLLTIVLQRNFSIMNIGAVEVSQFCTALRQQQPIVQLNALKSRLASLPAERLHVGNIVNELAPLLQIITTIAAVVNEKLDIRLDGQQDAAAFAMAEAVRQVEEQRIAVAAATTRAAITEQEVAIRARHEAEAQAVIARNEVTIAEQRAIVAEQERDAAQQAQQAAAARITVAEDASRIAEAQVIDIEAALVGAQRAIDVVRADKAEAEQRAATAEAVAIDAQQRADAERAEKAAIEQRLAAAEAATQAAQQAQRDAEARAIMAEDARRVAEATAAQSAAELAGARRATSEAEEAKRAAEQSAAEAKQKAEEAKRVVEQRDAEAERVSEVMKKLDVAKQEIIRLKEEKLELLKTHYNEQVTLREALEQSQKHFEQVLRLLYNSEEESTMQQTQTPVLFTLRRRNSLPSLFRSKEDVVASSSLAPRP